MGVLKLKATQAERLGLKLRSQLSPLLEKCCLRLSANESYQNAEAEIEALTGMIVGHKGATKISESAGFTVTICQTRYLRN